MQRKFRPTKAAAISSLVIFLILVGLGTWQVERLKWKTAFLDRIHTQMEKKPLPLPEKIVQPEDWEFRRVTMAGRFLYQNEFLIKPRTRDGVNGYHMVVPFQRISGGVVFVNRGWISDAHMSRASRPEGILRIEGVVQLPRKSKYAPVNDPVKGDWFWADIGAMAVAARLPNVSPVLVAVAQKEQGVYPVGGKVEVNISNNHKQYAAFWFLMAVISQVIFFLRYWQPQPKA